MNLTHCRAWPSSVHVSLHGHPPPRMKRCSLFRDVFVLCEAPQLNGPWLGEVSSADLRVTPRQWWSGFYGKNKKQRPLCLWPLLWAGLWPFWKEEALKCPCIRGDVWISIQALVGQVVAAWCCKFLSVRSPLRIYITPTQPHSLMLKAFFLCLYQKMMMCDMKSVLMP